MWKGDSTGEISVLKLAARAPPLFALHVPAAPLLRASLLARRGRDAEAGPVLAEAVVAPTETARKGVQVAEATGLSLAGLHRALAWLSASDVLAGAACVSRQWLLASAFRLVAG